MGVVKLLCVLVHIVCLGVTFNEALPIDAQQRILDALQEQGLGDVTGSPQPVYRLDKADDFVAYYMVEVDNQYLLITASDQTGDVNVALQGDLPSPISAMNGDGSCSTYFLMIPSSDSMVCKNSDGTIVADTLPEEYKAAAAESDGYTNLNDYITGQLDNLAELWQEHAQLIKEQNTPDEAEGKDAPKDSDKMELEIPNAKSGDDGFAIDPIEPGDSKDVAVGDKIKKIIVKYIPLKSESNDDAKAAQEKLCSAIENCKMKKGEGRISGSNVDSLAKNAIKKVAIILHKAAQTMLGGKESVFSVDAFDKNDKIVSVVFQVSYPPLGKGYKYGSWRHTYKYVPYSHLLPHYYNTKVNGCWPGSVAVGWAYIFGYYDRRTHYGNWGYRSYWLYMTSSDGFAGSYKQVAPTVNDSRMNRYMRRLAQLMHAACSGSTLYSNIDDVWGFYRYRQLGNPFFRKCWTGGYSSACANFIFDEVSKGWPVLNLYNNHGTVAIGRRESIRYRRFCFVFCGSWKLYNRDRYMLIDTLKRGNSRVWVGLKAFYAISPQH